MTSELVFTVDDHPYLRKRAQAVAEAAGSDHDKNNELNRQAFAAARWGESDEDIRRVMTEAALASGQNMNAARKTIENGIRDGAAERLRVGDMTDLTAEQQDLLSAYRAEHTGRFPDGGVAWLMEWAAAKGLLTRPQGMPRLLRVGDIDLTPPKYLVPPFLSDAKAIHINFGDGGSLKTTLLAGITMTLAGRSVGLTGDGVVRPVVILPTEDPEGIYLRLLQLGCTPADPVFHLPVELSGKPLWEQMQMAADMARYELAEGGASTAVGVIDSLSFGLGANDISDSTTADLLMRAAATAGMPFIASAHQTKAGDTTKPFGSAMWHNGARMTWHSSYDRDTRIVTLTCRKANAFDMRGEVRTYEVGWGDEGEVTGFTPKHIAVSLERRIYDALGTDGLTYREMVEVGLGSYASVRQVVSRHADLFIKPGRGTEGKVLRAQL